MHLSQLDGSNWGKHTQYVKFYNSALQLHSTPLCSRFFLVLLLSSSFNSVGVYSAPVAPTADIRTYMQSLFCMFPPFILVM